MLDILIENIGKIHTTGIGVNRIRNNLDLGEIDVVAWCKNKILDNRSIKKRKCKNWYVHIDGYVIIINASSYTIITCHKNK